MPLSDHHMLQCGGLVEVLLPLERVVDRLIYHTSATQDIVPKIRIVRIKPVCPSLSLRELTV